MFYYWLQSSNAGLPVHERLIQNAQAKKQEWEYLVLRIIFVVVLICILLFLFACILWFLLYLFYALVGFLVVYSVCMCVLCC